MGHNFGYIIENPSIAIPIFFQQVRKLPEKSSLIYAIDWIRQNHLKVQLIDWKEFFFIALIWIQEDSHSCFAITLNEYMHSAVRYMLRIVYLTLFCLFF